MTNGERWRNYWLVGFAGSHVGIAIANHNLCLGLNFAGFLARIARRKALRTEEGRLSDANQETLKIAINTLIWSILRCSVAIPTVRAVIPSNGALNSSGGFLKRSSGQFLIVSNERIICLPQQTNYAVLLESFIQEYGFQKLLRRIQSTIGRNDRHSAF